MNLFLSWSGPRSKHIAESLRNWIPKVLQAVKPWMSDQDISMGARWSPEITKKLEDSKVGVICLTPENQHNPWLMFEAGALSKTVDHTYVCPYLFDLQPAQLSGPIAQFQAALANNEGTLEMIKTLNKSLEGLHIPSPRIDEIFEMWWSKLEEQLALTPEEGKEIVTERSTSAILEEVLQNTREQLRREEIRADASRLRDEVLGNMMGNWQALYAPISSTIFPAAYTHVQRSHGEGARGEAAPYAK